MMEGIMKLINIIFLILLTTILTSQTLHSEESEEGVLAQKGLGLTAGGISGIGIAYRRHYENRWGFQLGGGFWGEFEDYFTINSGLEFLRTIGRTKNSRLYGVGGFSLHRTWEKYRSLWRGNAGTMDEVYFTFLTGLGIGIEVGEQDQGFSGSLELPFTLILREDDVNSISPIPGISLTYYFESK
jgi:hypothetical protein